MIVIETKNGSTDALIWTEAPGVYMDMWALSTFARDQALQRQFLKVFEQRGTLLISTMLAVEIGANQATTWPEMRVLLDAIGPRWLPLTVDAFAVMDAQAKHGSAHEACISHGFINDRKFAVKLQAGDLSLGNVVDLTRGQDGIALKASADQGTAQMTADVSFHRAEHAKNPKYLAGMWPDLPWDPAKYMRPIYNAFLRQTVKDSFKFTDNHARDLFHAIASVGCAHITLLDMHWAVQARKVERQLKSPTGFVKIYDPSQLLQFLADLTRWPKTRGTPKPTAL